MSGSVSPALLPARRHSLPTDMLWHSVLWTRAGRPSFGSAHSTRPQPIRSAEPKRQTTPSGHPTAVRLVSSRKTCSRPLILGEDRPLLWLRPRLSREEVG